MMRRKHHHHRAQTSESRGGIGGSSRRRLSWNRCFLCSSPSPVIVTERQVGVWNHDGGGVSGGDGGQCRQVNNSVKLLMKYLLHDFKLEEPLSANVISLWGGGGDAGAAGGGGGDGGDQDQGFTAKVCSCCGVLVESITRLTLELEATQMTIVSRLEVLKKAVINNSRLYGVNDEVRRDFDELEEQLRRREEEEAGGGEDSCRSGRRFLDVIHHFQTFVFENDSKQFHIPLVYLERLTGGKKKMNLAAMSHGLHLSGSPGLNMSSIKEEPRDSFEPMIEEMEEEADTDFELAGPRPPADIKCEDQSPPPPAPATRRRGRRRKSAQLASARFKKSPLQVRKCEKAKEASQPKKLLVSQAQLLYRRLMKEKHAEAWAGGKMKKHHRSPPEFTCETCGLVLKCISNYQQEQHLREHESETTSTSEKNFKCPDCPGIGFSQKQYFELHLSYHSVGRRKGCEICGKSVPFTSLESHLRSHQPDKIFGCEFCSIWFATWESLVTHLTKSHRKVWVKCELCSGEDQDSTNDSNSRKYQVSSELPRHLSEIHGKSQFQLKCPFEGCSETFYNQISLMAHRALHTGVHTCSICSKSFKSGSCLARHTRLEHPDNVKVWFYCDASACKEKFLTKTLLLRHQILEHNKPKLKCDHCLAEFITQTTLQTHLRLNHGVGKAPPQLICSHCGKSNFRKRAQWRIHEASHTREKAFTCEICGFGTHSEELLRGHKKARHDEKRERRYQCPQCPSAFFDGHTLKLHIRRHTGDRPYQCDDCGSTFTQKSALGVHKKKHVEGSGFVPRGPRPNVRKKKKRGGEFGDFSSGKETTGSVVSSPPPPPLPIIVPPAGPSSSVASQLQQDIKTDKIENNFVPYLIQVLPLPPSDGV